MEDIFGTIQAVTGIIKYSSSEVITPKEIVTDMVDLLPAGIYTPEAKFLDPAVKSGRFLAEIYRRLMDSELMKQAFPDEQARHEHILDNQLYGFATSELSATVVRKQLYDNPLTSGNIRFTSAKVTKEMIQGAFGIMKFDVVIGNPPYNKGMDLDFVDMGFELAEQYTVMITPAKWQTAEANQKVVSKMSYGEFRKELVPHMSHVCFYPDCVDVFDISQTDGITYFLLSKEQPESCTVSNKCKVQRYFNSCVQRTITNRESLLNIGAEIVQHLEPYNHFKFPPANSGRYEVWTNNQVSKGGGARGGVGILNNLGNTQCVGISRVLDTKDAVDMGMRTGASTCSFSSDSRQECEHFVSWLNTKFTRFFVAINISKLTGIICDDCFRFVPAPPSGKFDHIYTDAELYEAFNLPQKYIDVIEAVIKERK
ncbi:Eco57I restriction-modification methylase domain-containing protein [Oscillibacter valericigenes]|uniref:Eco57I restriction-modification methylase domain-containing protein n=1 Tax=Oscillibacter valericigenes TaxID=351091 RepID=UPI001F467DB8|nr:Eco57I restriction-modification methylase domain-containing protein [Oscillibacter valericigenes]